MLSRLFRWQRWATRTVGIALVGSLVACGASEDDDPSARENGGEPNAQEPDVAETLQFGSESVELNPGESRTLTVRATPPGTYQIRFALLGDAEDASLDRTAAVSEPDGTTQVQLTAPSDAAEANFVLRASVGDAVVAEIQVGVSSQGPAQLRIKPSYEGARQVEGWVATVRFQSCAELGQNPPTEDALSAESAADSQPSLEIEAGRPLSVTVSSGEMISGCVDVAELAPEEQQTIEVPVSDVPLRLSDTPLNVSIQVEALEPGWTALLEPELLAFTQGMLGSTGDDVDALLSAIADVEDAPVDLTYARASGGWDGALVSFWGEALAPRALRRPLERWYREAVSSIDDEMLLEASLVPSADEEGKAQLVPILLAGFPALDAAFPESVPASYRSEPGDQVLLGVPRFAWQPWGLFTAATLANASDSDGEDANPVRLADMLATSINCPGLSRELQVRALTAMESCEPACLESICRQAVRLLLDRGVAALEERSFYLDLSATATATVDTTARPTSFLGSWVGTLEAGDTIEAQHGTIEATLPADVELE